MGGCGGPERKRFLTVSIFGGCGGPERFLSVSVRIFNIFLTTFDGRGGIDRSDL